MSYKVFLVEDEIVTREGIRDNVDWSSVGFDFCGEAEDGEIALPLIEQTQPDVLITDIKMPFMDGLQLCKIVRSQMPWVKIIVLSGHDEFEFAQSAIKLGVSEYLLKPISAVEIKDALQDIATVLDQERDDRENLKRLQGQVKDILSLKRERLLLELVVGGISSTKAIEEYGQIGLNLIARYYLVILVKVSFFENNGHLDPALHQKIQDIVINLANSYPGAFFTQKSVEELLLVMVGEDSEQLIQDGRFLAELIKNDIEEAIGFSVSFGVGSIQQRLTNIHLSFADALAVLKQSDNKFDLKENQFPGALMGASIIEQTAVEHFLKTGLIGDFEPFFEKHLLQISESALDSTLIKHYLIVDIILLAAQFIDELGGKESEVIPELADIQSLLANLRTLDQIYEALRNIFSEVIALRNDQAHYDKAEVIFQAKAYIDGNFSNPNLLLDDVAATVNLSASHFSMVFSREAGEPFKNYLTRLRVDRAKELLRSTGLKCSDIAYLSGYNDPHYFSFAFKKFTGLSPQQYRDLSGS